MNGQVPAGASSELMANSALLGNEGLPVWLNPERFLHTEFDAEACVADLRRYVPLATLQSELNNYLTTLKGKLVEVLNEDYSDYVGLAGRLTNVEGAVIRMRKPLHELKDKLHAVHMTVKGELNTLNQGLRRRQEVSTQRGLLELIQEVAHVAAKVEKLLEEVAAADTASAAAGATAAGTAGGADAGAKTAAADDGGQGQGQDLRAHSRLLERVAAEISRLNFLAARGKDLAFIRTLEPRIAAHRAALSGRLSSTLSAALASHDHAAALHCLAAYADLGDTAPAEAAVRTVVVAPLVEQLIRDQKSTSGGVTVSGAPHGAALTALLAEVLAAVRKALGPLLDATLSAGSALRAVDLLGAAVVEEVQGALAASLPGVFSPGVPPAFHANYLATMAWLGQLEGLCTTRAAVERLRSGTPYTALMRRWNTSVYFSLLFQEIAGELEDALAVPKLEPAVASSSAGGSSSDLQQLPAVQLAATSALLRCLRRAVSRDVVLPLLADRFLRLVLQLATRYAAWVAAGTQARREAAAAAAAEPGNAAPGAPAGAAGAATPGSSPAPATAAGMPGGAGAASEAPAPGSCSWMAALPAEELAAVIYDAERTVEFLETDIGPAFLELLPAAPPPAPNDPSTQQPVASVSGGVQAALAEASADVRSQGRGLAAVLAEETVDKCVAVVRQLKGITATYRMTSKGPPSRHSHYVTGVLTPLKALLDTAQMRRLSPELRQEALVVPVAGGVCSRYAQLAEELLLSVRKTESSLKRLKKARAPGEDGGTPGGDAVSDSDKITLQLHLDVQELGAQLERTFGLRDPAASLPAFQRLQEVVAPPPGLLPVPGQQ